MTKKDLSRPDVAVLVPNLQGGGAERIAVALVGGFIQRGLTVDVVLKHKAGALLNDISQEASLIEIGHRGLHAPTYSTTIALRRYLRKRNPRAILSFLNPMSLPALCATKFGLCATSAPVFVTVQNIIRIHGSLRSRLKHAAVSMLYPLADGVIACSDGLAEQVRSLMQRNTHRVIAIPNFLACDNPTALAAEPSCHRWLDSKDLPVILSVGGMVPQKDFPTLIKAFAEVRKRREAKLIIVGDAEGRPRLENLVRELRLMNDVDMPGFKANPLAFMARSDVCVLSSAWEGMPLVLVESLSCGTHVVATDCQFGPSEILKEGEYGRLVPVGDPSAMAQAILQTLDNPLKTKDELRQRAAYYSLDRAVDQYLEVLGFKTPARESVHDFQTA